MGINFITDIGISVDLNRKISIAFDIKNNYN